MANDMQASLSVRLNQVLTGLGQAEAGMARVTAQLEKMNRADKDFQRTAGVGLKKAGAEAERVKDPLAKVGQAMARMGGPAGSGIGQLMGGWKDGWLGRLAVGAGVAGIAFAALNRVTEVNIDRAQKATKAWMEMAAAQQQGARAAQGRATSGLSQVDAVTEVVVAGGTTLKKQAEEHAAANGIPLNEAYRGIALERRMRRTGARYGGARRAATEFAAAGGSFLEGMESIRSNPMLQARLDSADEDAPQQVAAMLLQKQLTGRTFGASTIRLREAQRNIAQDPFLRGAGQTTGVQNQIAIAEQGKVANGEAMGALRSSLAEVMNPVAAALVELAKNRQLELSVLERLAATQPALVRALMNLTSPQGSFEVQRLRTMSANAASGD
jgi:hypothetical protein